MKSFILVIILLFPVPLAQAFDYEPKNYLAYYHIYLNDNNRNVHIWFVEHGDDIPICEKKPGVILWGCTRYFIDPFHADYVYVVFTDRLDEYGNTFLTHELTHVICSCNWHD